MHSALETNTAVVRRLPAQTKAELPTLRGEITKVLKRAKNDPEEAFAMIWDKLDNDPKLYRALADEMVRKALRTEIRLMLDSERNSTFSAKRFTSSTPAHAASQSASVRRLFAAEARRISDLVVAGKRIGSCTRDDFIKLADDRLAKSRTMVANAKYFQALADGMADGQTAEDRYTEADFEVILKQTGVDLSEIEGGANA